MAIKKEKAAAAFRKRKVPSEEAKRFAQWQGEQERRLREWLEQFKFVKAPIAPGTLRRLKVELPDEVWRQVTPTLPLEAATAFSVRERLHDRAADSWREGELQQLVTRSKKEAINRRCRPDQEVVNLYWKSGAAAIANAAQGALEQRLPVRCFLAGLRLAQINLEAGFPEISRSIKAFDRAGPEQYAREQAKGIVITEARRLFNQRSSRRPSGKEVAELIAGMDLVQERIENLIGQPWKASNIRRILREAKLK
jgi:hypothetical protein